MLKSLNSILGVTIGTGIFLLIPFIAMQFTTDVNWSVSDFLIAGCVLFITGTAIVFTLRLKSNIIYRLAFLTTIVSAFLMIWVNLAVGLIGSGANLGNLMYIGVLVILIVGIYLSRYKSEKLEVALFSTALSLVVLGIVALLMNMQEYPGSSVMEIILVNLFFAGLFAIAGLLFRSVALRNSETHQ